MYHSSLYLIFHSQKAEQPTTHFLNPLKVLHCLENVMSDDSIIVADGGDFVGSAAYILRYDCYHSHFQYLCNIS